MEKSMEQAFADIYHESQKKKNLIENQEAADSKEQHEQVGLRVMIASSQKEDLISKVLNNIVRKKRTDQQDNEIVENLESLPEEIEKCVPDVVIAFSYMPRDEEAMIRAITKTRNNLEIENQPVFIVPGFSSASVERIVESGADVGFALPFNLQEFEKKLSSAPELLGFIEDQYGDKMLKNKKGFYREYKDMLADRSKITADTEKETEILEEIFAKNKSKKILDAGGGSGRIAVPLSEAGFDVSILDSSHDLLGEAKSKNDNLKIMEGDIREVPVKEDEFDAVTYNWHVICEILGTKGKIKTLSEAYRILRPGGVVVFDMPDREEGEEKKDGVYINYPSRDPKKPFYVGYVPSISETESILLKAGFSGVEIKKWKTGKGFPKITFIGKKS
jgi:ubiquinone/menaquinone biosynthesis C-methylase UbiE